MNLEQIIKDQAKQINGDKYIFYVTHTLGEHLRFFSYIPSIRKYFSHDKKIVFVIWKKYIDILMLFEEKPDLTLCYEVPVTEEQGAEAFANSDLAINEIIYPGTILKHKKIFDQLMKDVGEIGFRAYLGIPKLAPVQKIKIQKNNKISYNNKSLLFCLHSLSLRPPSNEYIQLLISTASKKGWSVYFDDLRGVNFQDGKPVSGNIPEILTIGHEIDLAGGVVVTMSSGLTAGFYLAKVPQVILYPGSPPYGNPWFSASQMEYGSDYSELSFESELGKFEYSELPVKFYDSESLTMRSIDHVIDKIEYLQWAKKYR